MTNDQDQTTQVVWEEMYNKCDEIIVKIQEKKKRKVKKEKVAASPTK